ncbi:unnamed protein product, partial [Nesidiocoris tenuis]
MLYDSGASHSVISKRTWKEIGHPKLSTTKNLVAYTGVEIETLGTAQVQVNAFNKIIELPVMVVQNNDVPLFGMKWILAFNLTLPPGTRIRNVHTTSEKKETEQVEQLIQKFAVLFKDGTGKINTTKAVVHMKPGAVPRVCKPRRVPFAVQDAVAKELDRLVAEDILEVVDPTITPIEWASPIVVAVKANGKIRICADFKITINPFIHSDPHPLPTFEDLVTKLTGGQQFSVIDLKDAYLQMEVEEQSRKYFVIATHKGYFRYKRLPFGVTFAPGLFQRTMDNLLMGLEGVACLLDDIIITGRTRDEHMSRLETVLERLSTAGLRVQKAKCKWFQNEVTYIGHKLNKDGMQPTTSHLEAIVKMPEPSSVKELRAFLGSINYYSRFIPNLQSECTPLYDLLKKRTTWRWTEIESSAIKKLKSLLTSTTILAHYDPKLPIIVSSDASDKGLGAVIFHRLPDNSERPIAFASRTLKNAEQHYSAIDKETLGIIFALTKFRQFLYGRQFVLRTDHKPLIYLLSQNKEVPKLAANRLTRWALTLSSFDYTIEHQPGVNNSPADALSRLPLPTTERALEEEDGNTFGKRILQIQMEDMVLNKRFLQKETKSDRTLARVIEHVQRGWPENKTQLDKELHTFFEKRTELSYEENLLLWFGRLIVPEKMRKAALRVLHEGHPGITGMRAAAKSHVWWPNIDREIEHHVSSCTSCQESHPKEQEVPLFSWSVPSERWSRLHLDFCGPFE